MPGSIVMRQSGAETLATEEPYELIAHVRDCGGAGWATTGSTRKPTPYSVRSAPAFRRGSLLAFYGRSEGTISMTYATKELTPATWADFERLFAPGRGWSFCACMLYQRGCHLDAKRFPDRASSLAQNQAEKRALVDAGRAHGILVYDDSEPIGWCQFGPPDELPLPGATRLDRRIPPLSAGVRWRITCFVTVVRRRQRGIASIALRRALKAIRERGGGLVEAYPTLTPRDANWAHAGTVSLFEREGFGIVGWPSEKYVVMQREVRPVCTSQRCIRRRRRSRRCIRRRGAIVSN